MTKTLHHTANGYIADSMLGKLAKLLRLLGYDVLYEKVVDDEDLIEWVEDSGRTLLTRDSRLAQRKALAGKLLLIVANAPMEQAASLLPLLPPAPGPFTRCTICNSLLHFVSGEEVRTLVPPYVYRTQSKFARCPGCSRVYWSGTHVARAMQMLDLLRSGEKKG